MIRKLIVELALSEYLHKRNRLVPASIPVSNQSSQFIWILRRGHLSLKLSLSLVAVYIIESIHIHLSQLNHFKLFSTNIIH